MILTSNASTEITRIHTNELSLFAFNLLQLGILFVKPLFQLSFSSFELIIFAGTFGCVILLIRTTTRTFQTGRTPFLDVGHCGSPNDGCLRSSRLLVMGRSAIVWLLHLGISHFSDSLFSCLKIFTCAFIERSHCCTPVLTAANGY